MADNILAEQIVQRNKASQIRIQLLKLRDGRVSVDLREYYLDEADNYRPSPRGFRLGAEKLADLIRAAATLDEKFKGGEAA